MKQSMVRGEFKRLYVLINERDRLYGERVRGVEKVVDERERLYDSRFKAAEVAVNAALAAQEKAVNAAFTASEKAIVKAEQAQKEYNERSNEFRAQLDDQAKTLMPRPETLSLFKAVDDKLIGAQINAKNELEALRSSFDKTNAALDAQIIILREFRSEGGGRARAQHDFTLQKNWSVGLYVGVAIALVEILFRLWK
jgi:hypothetical protein